MLTVKLFTKFQQEKITEAMWAASIQNLIQSSTLLHLTGLPWIFPDMDYLGIWHWPHVEVDYVCIEPWSSLPSRKNVVEDLEKQADLLSLESGQEYTNTWSITIKEK